MHEATANIPKCMMEVWNMPLIDRTIKTLECAGIDKQDIVIITGYKDNVIRNHIEGVHYLHNDRWNETNMVMTLTKAENILKNEDCVVCYSDIVFSNCVIKKIVSVDEDIVIPYYTKFKELWMERFDNPLDDLETFKFEGNQLLEIGNSPTTMDEVMGQYMGIIKIKPNGWRQISCLLNTMNPSVRDKLDMTTLFKTMLGEGMKIYCVHSDELWLECDTEYDVRLYNKKYPEYE